MRRYEYVPERLRGLMNERGWAAKDLAEKTAIDVGTVREYLNGSRTSISTRNMVALANVFNMSLASFMDYLAKI